MQSHVALDTEILLMVEITLIPNTQRRQAEAYPVNLIPLSWITWTGLAKQAKKDCLKFLAMTSLDSVSMGTSLVRNILCPVL